MSSTTWCWRSWTRTSRAGGPDFDHEYLLLDLDRLAERFRLVSYDQRGRGRAVRAPRQEPSAAGWEFRCAFLATVEFPISRRAATIGAYLRR